MALIKSYARSEGSVGSTVHLIENAKNVTYDEGYYINNETDTVLGQRDDRIMVYHNHVAPGDACRVIDFDNEYGVRQRLYTSLAYICNDTGKTMEKLGVDYVPSPQIAGNTTKVR